MPITAEVMPEKPLHLSAKLFGFADHRGLLGDDSEAAFAEDGENVVPDFSEKAAGKPPAGHGHMTVVSLEDIEDDAANDLAILLNPETGKRGVEFNANNGTDFFGYPDIPDDQVMMSDVS